MIGTFSEKPPIQKTAENRGFGKGLGTFAVHYTGKEKGTAVSRNPLFLNGKR